MLRVAVCVFFFWFFCGYVYKHCVSQFAFLKYFFFPRCPIRRKYSSRSIDRLSGCRRSIQTICATRPKKFEKSSKNSTDSLMALDGTGNTLTRLNRAFFFVLMLTLRCGCCSTWAAFAVFNAVFEFAFLKHLENVRAFDSQGNEWYYSLVAVFQRKR